MVKSFIQNIKLVNLKSGRVGEVAVAYEMGRSGRAGRDGDRGINPGARHPAVPSIFDFEGENLERRVHAYGSVSAS
jgi:hypothetical protein